MKRVLFGTLAGTIFLCAGGAWGENWKLLSTDEKTNLKYYYDTTSVKKGKGGRVTVTTKTESGKGPAQKWQMELDCDKSRYRFINPNHEWAPTAHGTPAGVLEFRVCN
ncbi:MAG TPA: hypothetical protein VIU40_10645 [Geobacteraceae bacterium]